MGSPHHTLLGFAEHGASLPNLTVAQQTKLKQLTVVSLAQGTKVPQPHLQTPLGSTVQTVIMP